MQTAFATFLLVGTFGLTTVSAQPAVTAPGRSLARSADGFTQIGGLHEFADGRVLIVDFRENRVVMLDFARNTSRDLTRPGEGPAELPLALTILPWSGDSVLVGGHRHALKLTSSGTIVDKLSNSFQVLPSYSAPAFADRSGRLYGSTRDALQPDPMGGFIPPLGGWVLCVASTG